MKVVLTLMVRDEADIIAATLEHHLAEGVDHIIVTDNGSTDGTREILEDYATVAPVTVFDDLEHRKQQGEVVTRMARLAYSQYGADWVVNGDADEFVMAIDRSLSLKDVFHRLPTEIESFAVPVVNLVGPMARRGSGIRRLLYRDERTESQLHGVGLLSHPTPNAIHVGSPDVDVSQGNHFTSLELGTVPATLQLEVFHLPWRSVGQIARKTENTGRGYEASPHLRPSPKHHGMRDWRRLKGGLLDAFLALRTPTVDELGGPGFVRETSFCERMESLADRALVPGRYQAAMDDRRDEVLADGEVLDLRQLAGVVQGVERELYDEIVALRAEIDDLEQRHALLHAEFAAERQRLANALDDAHAELIIQAERREALEERNASLGRDNAALLQRVQRLERHPIVRAGMRTRLVLRRLRRP